ncbi:hypothetical protein [Paraclostridium bifermentans]|uniref:hypothetical protein n=1 Tax=Paraclostridium bifermentans TaxID=1490 RepID=UPI00374E339E
MKNIIARVIVIGIMLVCLFFVGVFKLPTAVGNYEDYFKLASQAKTLKTKMETTKDETAKARQALRQTRGDGAVDIEDVNALYTAVTKLPGVENKVAYLLRIKGEKVEVLGEYNASAGEKNNKADGIQIIVVTKNVPKFLEGLEKLKTPYERLNVVYYEGKVAITYNTKGGQV